MSYKIYTTRGFVFETFPQGESNLFVKVFTKDFGLLLVIAQGTRLLKSKLRYGIQELTYGSFSFVRGKEYWRLTSVEKLMSFTGVNVRVGAKRNIKLAFTFIDRFIKGEEKNIELFELLEQYVKFILLEYSKDTSEKYPDSYVNLVLKLNVLSLLGYTTTNDILQKSLCNNAVTMSDAILNAATLALKDIQFEVEKIISETHL